MRRAVSPAGAWRWRAASCESNVPARASPGTDLSTSVGWTFNVNKDGQVACQRSFLSSRPSEDDPAPSSLNRSLLTWITHLIYFFPGCWMKVAGWVDG